MGDRSATANYIAAMSGELAGLAAGAGLGFLSHLLRMARDEANSITAGDAQDNGAPPIPFTAACRQQPAEQRPT